jgi:hypothetical protein
MLEYRITSRGQSSGAGFAQALAVYVSASKKINPYLRNLARVRGSKPAAATKPEAARVNIAQVFGRRLPKSDRNRQTTT